MPELYCTIDRTYAKYNCGPSGDVNDKIGSDNSWADSNEGTSRNPSLGIYSGYASWNDEDDNPSGSFNWRSVIKFTVPATLPSTSRIDELVVRVPLKGNSSVSYPHHSYVILSDKSPSEVTPNQLCHPGLVTVNASGKKRNVDCTVNGDIALGVPPDSRAYAYLIENNKYVRASRRIDYDTNLYYRLLPSSLTAGKTYYLYFVRQGKCSSTSGCVRSNNSGHGASGYVHLRISKNDDAFVKIKYTNSVTFSLAASIDNGTSKSDFSANGKATFELGGRVYSDQTSFNSSVTPGTSFKLSKVIATPGYEYVGSLPTKIINSDTTHVLDFTTKYTLTFIGNGGAQKTQTKLKGASYTMPTYESLFGKVPEGRVFRGWKNGKSTYLTGSTPSVDGMTSKVFTADLGGIAYKLKYRVDNEIVHTQDVIHGEAFTLERLTGDYMKTTERNFVEWRYSGNKFNSGVWSYTSDVIIDAVFDSKSYSLRFEHNGVVIKNLNATYGTAINTEGIIPTSIPTQADTKKLGHFDNSYQKLNNWVLNDGSTSMEWSTMVNSKNCVGDVITFKSVIGPRFKIVVYKDRGWRVLTPIVSRETKWSVLHPRIER